MDRQLPDVQASVPEVTVGLNRVGVTGVEKLVEVARPDSRPIVLMAEFEVLVDLPRSRKGADMSRNMEVVDEILEEAVREPTFRIEDVCGDAAERLLSKHDYTTKAEVRMEADLVLREETPETNRPTQTKVRVIAGAVATDDGTREEIGARVTGMTVCPCSQGMMEERARERLRDLAVDEESVQSFLADVPQA
ncbi:MAG: GTP cyclohydrolase MptA, partial [Halobacteriales archaeon]|nr:GTP cyclohydrolase MptA [Halobacteriales archaeon]